MFSKQENVCTSSTVLFTSYSIVILSLNPGFQKIQSTFENKQGGHHLPELENAIQWPSFILETPLNTLEMRKLDRGLSKGILPKSVKAWPFGLNEKFRLEDFVLNSKSFKTYRAIRRCCAGADPFKSIFLSTSVILERFCTR